MKSEAKKVSKLRKRLQKQQRKLTKKLRSLEKKLRDLASVTKVKPTRAKAKARAAPKSKAKAKVKAKATSVAKAGKPRSVKAKTVSRKARKTLPSTPAFLVPEEKAVTDQSVPPEDE